MKILIVDDSMMYRRTMVKFLRKEIPDAEYLTAVNGKEGYDMFKEHDPDFLIVDLLMPEIDGLELMRMIKKDNPAARAVIISADIQDYTREEVEKLNILKFINKPITEDKIADLVAIIRGV